MTTIPSGLGATFGFAEESAVGTFVASTRWYEAESEAFELKKKIADSKALRGALYMESKRRAFVTKTVDGKIAMDLTENGMGFFFRHMLGSFSTTAVQQASSAAYLQVHKPGPLVGHSFSYQKGIPETDGTIQAFSYNGCKITEWEIDVAAGELAKLSLTVDGWNESTSQSYTAATEPSTEPFNFQQAALSIGGTVTTTSGTSSVSGGVTSASVLSAKISGKNPLKVDRYFLGSNGIKAEQLDNGFRTIDFEAEIEFENLTDAYTAFAADTGVAIQLTLESTVAIASTYYPTVQILIPVMFFEGESPKVTGPDVVKVAGKASGYDDGTDNVIQITYMSSDVSV